MKEMICTLTGIVGSFVAGIFGGWDAAMASLLLFMAVDYTTGLIVAASGKSPKSEGGGLSSATGWHGIAKKCVMLLLVLVAARLDLTLGTSYIRDAVCIAFLVNELLSIVENAGLLGIPLPNALKKAIDLLQEKEEKK
jgi:toxin secretion/phage lysis holin